MTAVQLLTGRGGWPLNVVCLPNGTPIYGGTYHTRAQWIQILERVRERYENNPEQLENLSKKVAEGIAAVNVIDIPENPKPFDETFFEKPIRQWEKNFDLIYGGEIGKQKFIRPSKFHFLRQYQELSKNSSINEYIETSLHKIATSGVYDALEGGFFRYSVDPYWKVPHFEKMLYDNAQMVGLYAEAFKNDAKPIYRQRVEETIAFLKNRMAAKGVDSILQLMLTMRQEKVDTMCLLKKKLKKLPLIKLNCSKIIMALTLMILLRRTFLY